MSTHEESGGDFMRILVPVFSPATGTWGGLTRVVAFAQAAQGIGHQIAFVASGPLADDLRKHGYTVYAAPASTLLGLPRPVARIFERRSQRVTLPVRPGKSIGNLGLVYLLSGLARASYLRQELKAELDAVTDFQPQALFTDLDPGAYILARITGLPIATAFQGIMLEGIDSRTWKLAQRSENSVLNEHGLAALPLEELHFGSEVLKIIPSIPELDGTDPNRADVCYVGHLLAPIKPSATSKFKPVQERRYVFVYVGTGALSLDILREVLPKVFPSGGNLTCLVGSQSIREVERVEAVEFRPYVPAEAVLPHCDWTICHGGQNTIIQSLRHGVPLLVFPGPIFERRFNASKVQEAGAGMMAEIDQFTPQWLRAALGRQYEFAPRATILGGKINAYNGPRQAVKALEAHAIRN
jgi:UDP:flavonoid glycosyltransferase YjiC (YdhE family)